MFKISKLLNNKAANFFSTLKIISKELPFAPHSPAFLASQKALLEEQYPHMHFERVMLSRGSKLTGLNMTLNPLYDCISLFRHPAQRLSIEKQRFFEKFYDKYRASIAEYTLEKDINCVKGTDKNGEETFYVHPEFLSLDNIYSYSSVFRALIPGQTNNILKI